MNHAIFRPAAAADVEDAHSFYQGQRSGLGDEFIVAVRAAIESVLEGPERYSVVHRQTRRILLKRFSPMDCTIGYSVIR